MRRVEWSDDFSQIVIVVDHRCSAMSVWLPVVATLCLWMSAGEFNARSAIRAGCQIDIYLCLSIIFFRIKLKKLNLCYDYLN